MWYLSTEYTYLYMYIYMYKMYILILIHVHVHVCVHVQWSSLLFQEPLESIITPAGFAPATRPPSSQPSQSSQQSQQLFAYSQALPHSSQVPQSHRDSPSQDSESSSYSTGVGGKTVPQSANKRASPLKQVVTSNDESAASVSPLEGVPQHPDLIDPGPQFTNTGTCTHTWGSSAFFF